MIENIKKQHSLSFKAFSLIINLAFISSLVILPPKAQAQSVFNLPAPGTMITRSISYNPPIMAGMTIHPDNPLKFDFIISTGDDDLEGESFRKESEKLINYFLATLTVPDDEMWVNLSPYEKDRIIAEGLGTTEMGRDMLVQDYMLKQLTASLMYPEEELGDKFWKKIYKKSQARFGTTEIPANTFNKVWIVPEEAVVYVNGANVFVSESHLKVMLEEDYLALESNQNSTSHGLGKMTKDDMEVISQNAKEAIREVILPEIEREVNEGKNFANLRQIYHSMILATWYKKNLRESILGKAYMDMNRVEGIDLDDKQIKEKIYDQYVEAFKRGVYDYIKEDYDEASQEIIPRKYFSGGLTRQESIVQGDLAMTSEISRATRGEIRVRRVQAETPLTDGSGYVVSSPLGTGGSDAAMIAYGDKENIAEFDRVAGDLLTRLQQEIDLQLNKKRFLEIMASSFGITEPDDEPAEGYYYARHKKALEAVEVLMAMPVTERNEVIATIVQEQNYVSWMASGNHRYMGLALAIVNLMNGRNIFNSATIDQLIEQDEEYRYLLENLLQYGNPYDVESEWVSSFIPSLNLPVPVVEGAGRYQWLDIGSTIASQGSPALNFIRRTVLGLGLSTGLDLHGVDVFASPYTFEDGEIKPSEVYSGLKEGGGTTQYQGVQYYDARNGQYNVADTQFQLGQQFDFISMIMTLHHLTQSDEIPETLSLARDVIWLDDNGEEINPVYDLTQTQRESIERLLSNLNPQNGILFLHLKEGVVRSGKMYSGNKRNDGQLVIIQRRGESTYQLFSPTVAFRPEKDPYSSIGFLMAPHPAPLYKTSGLRSIYAGQSESFYAGVEQWLTRADLLVFRHQRRNASVWGALQLAAEAIRAIEQQSDVSVEEGLGTIFSAYLSQTPDSEPLKASLLDGVREWSQNVDRLNKQDRELASKLGYEINSETGQGKRTFSTKLDDIHDELYLIRHGKMIKRQDALNDEGFGQAGELAQRMEEMLRSKLEQGEKVVLITSPRVRAKETLQPFVDLVRDRYGIEIEIVEDELADEMDLGDVPNLEPDQVSEVQKATFGQIFKQHNVTSRIEGAENLLNQIDRNRRLFKALKEKYPNIPVFVATHGIAIAAAIADRGDSRAVDEDGWLQWTNVIPGETEIVHLNSISDQAQLANPGGIDFNPGIMDFTELGGGFDFILDNTMLNNISVNSIEGVTPVIINITPITNFAPLLGRSDQTPAEQQLSSLTLN